jgi:hypothetical protein
MTLVLKYLYTGEMELEKTDIRGVGVALDFLLFEVKLLVELWHKIFEGYCNWFKKKSMNEGTNNIFLSLEEVL